MPAATREGGEADAEQHDAKLADLSPSSEAKKLTTSATTATPVSGGRERDPLELLALVAGRTPQPNHERGGGERHREPHEHPAESAGGVDQVVQARDAQRIGHGVERIVERSRPERIAEHDQRHAGEREPECGPPAARRQAAVREQQQSHAEQAEGRRQAKVLQPRRRFAAGKRGRDV